MFRCPSGSSSTGGPWAAVGGTEFPEGGTGCGIVAAPAWNHDRRLIQVHGMPLRRWLGTTPGLLRAASVLLIVGLLALGVVAATSAAPAGDAARAVGFETRRSSWLRRTSTWRSPMRTPPRRPSS